MGPSGVSCRWNGMLHYMNALQSTNTLQSKSVPRTANGNAIKQVKSASKAYEALAEAYVQLSNLPKLKTQIKYGAEIWAEVR